MACSFFLPDAGEENSFRRRKPKVKGVTGKENLFHRMDGKG
jgi:hypothetical protein